MKEKMLILNEVIEKTGLKPNTIYLWSRDGRFPGRHQIGKVRTGWKESEVNQWLEKRGQ